MLRSALCAVVVAAVCFACESSKSKTDKPVDSGKTYSPSSVPGIDASAVASSSFSVDKLREAVNSMSTGDLQNLANGLSKSIETNNGLVKSLQDQISKLSPGDAKADTLKSSLDSTTALVKSLKEKLQVVVDKLKASGIDVSKYTSFLPS
jgi:hypothetical protein